MNDFTFYSPTEFVFGRGITDSVGEKLSQKGYKRVLLVYGKGSVVRSGTLDRVKKSLAASHIEFSDLSGVRPNPEVNQVREGIEIAQSIVLPPPTAKRQSALKDRAISIPSRT